MGQGFQYTPGGIMPLDDAQAGYAQAAVHPAAPPNQQPTQQTLPSLAEVAPRPKQSAPAPRATAAQPVLGGTGQLIKAAKQRLRELNAEIKRLRSLERERDELQRLLKAAKQKPANNVRSLRSA